MKPRNLAFLFSLVSKILSAQGAYTDSLKTELNKIVTPASIKARLSAVICCSYACTYPDSVMPYALLGRQLGEKVNFPKGLVEIYSTLCEALITKDNYSTAPELTLKAIRF